MFRLNKKDSDMNAASLWATLTQLRDTFKLKTHLLGLDLLDRWHDVEHRCSELESKMVAKARQLGVAEEHYFVGSDGDIKQLIEDLEDLHKDAENNSKES